MSAIQRLCTELPAGSALDVFLVGLILGAVGMLMVLLALDVAEYVRQNTSRKQLWPDLEEERQPPAAPGLKSERHALSTRAIAEWRDRS